MTATCHPLRRALSTNSTDTAFATKVPTTTKPVNAGVWDLHSTDLGFALLTQPVPQYIFMQPYGGNSNDETFDFQLWAWNVVQDSSASVDGLWVPHLLYRGQVVLGNIAATDLGANMLLADTITTVVGDADVALLSPTGEQAAHVMVHIRGSQLIEFDFDLTGTADAANILWKPVDHP